MSFRASGRIRIPQWATVNRLVTANDITLDENGVETGRERTDLDGGIVYCTVRDASGTIVIQKDSTNVAQIEHLAQGVAATKGQARIKFVEADTAPLTVGAHYTFDVWVSTADGRIEPIVDKGRFYVDASDTRISDGPAPALPTFPAAPTTQDLATASRSLIFREGSPENGPVVFGTWSGVMDRLELLREAGGGDGSFEVSLDDSIVSPVVIPALPDTAPAVPTAAFTFASPTVTLTDTGAAFTSDLIGRWIKVAGATTPANDGTFLITGIPSGTQLEYRNEAGVAEAVGGATYSVTVPHNMAGTVLGSVGLPIINFANGVTINGLRHFRGNGFATSLSVAGSPPMISDFTGGPFFAFIVEGGFALNCLGGTAPPLVDTSIAGAGALIRFLLRLGANIALNPSGGSPIFHIGAAGQNAIFSVSGLSSLWRNGLSSVVGSTVSINIAYGHVVGVQQNVLGTQTNLVFTAGPKQNVDPVGTLPASTVPINTFSHRFEVLRLDVSGGGFTQILPQLPQANSSRGTGGRVTVKEESGSPGLLVQGRTNAPADTIEGSLDPFPVPPGGTVVFVNDGETNWLVESIYDPAAQLSVDLALISATPDALVSGRVARYNTTAGVVVANLPPANDLLNGGRCYVKNEVGANNVDATPNGADTIDGVAALSAVLPGLAAKFISDGVSNWTRI